MIRFLKIQENSGLANNRVDQMQMASAFARGETIAFGVYCCVARAEESSRHRNI
jgi:hypothetical protein